MAAPLAYPLHSIAEAAARIDQGEDLWFALGCFLHDWWCYAVAEVSAISASQPGE